MLLVLVLINQALALARGVLPVLQTSALPPGAQRSAASVSVRLHVEVAL